MLSRHLSHTVPEFESAFRSQNACRKTRLRAMATHMSRASKDGHGLPFRATCLFIRGDRAEY